MNKKNKYDKFFYIRMGVLLLLLAIFAGGSLYDRMVLVPGGMEAVEKIGNAKDKSEVKEFAGQSPTETETYGKFEVETYKFSRILPTLEGPMVSVIYSGEMVSEVINGPLNQEDIDGMIRSSSEKVRAESKMGIPSVGIGSGL